jgi:hypothetical protein
MRLTTRTYEHDRTAAHVRSDGTYAIHNPFRYAMSTPVG